MSSGRPSPYIATNLNIPQESSTFPVSPNPPGNIEHQGKYNSMIPIQFVDRGQYPHTQHPDKPFDSTNIYSLTPAHDESLIANRTLSDVNISECISTPLENINRLNMKVGDMLSSNTTELEDIRTYIYTRIYTVLEGGDTDVEEEGGPLFPNRSNKDQSGDSLGMERKAKVEEFMSMHLEELGEVSNIMAYNKYGCVITEEGDGIMEDLQFEAEMLNGVHPNFVLITY